MERFLKKISKNPATGCWDWQACKLAGYGRFALGKRPNGSGNTVAAHRFSYELHVGPIPQGFQIDHLCRNRGCVNPEHLEAVTPRVNVLRGDTVSAANVLKTHCPRGHAYDKVIPSTGERRCRTCCNEQKRRWATADRARRRLI